MPMRIALFGGSFDPVHCAHLELARSVLQQTDANRVIFIPASRSPLKHEPLARDADRLQMLRLAIRGEVGFELNTFEIEQSGKSFTIDTVDHFRELYEGASLYWIIGEDQFFYLDQWRRIDDLAKKVTFLVYPRLEKHRAVEKPVNGLYYQFLKADRMPVSSTEIRERCKRGLSLDDLVPDLVEAFIHENGLYKENS